MFLGDVLVDKVLLKSELSAALGRALGVEESKILITPDIEFVPFCAQGSAASTADPCATVGLSMSTPSV